MWGVYLHAQAGALPSDTAMLLQRTIRFADKRAAEAMTPRVDVVALRTTATVAELQSHLFVGVHEPEARTVRAALTPGLQQVFGMAEGLLNYTRPGDPPEIVDNTQGAPLSAHDELRVVDDAGAADRAPVPRRRGRSPGGLR